MKISIKWIMISALILSSMTAQDDFDFFEPTTTIGGYGELHYNRKSTGDSDASTKLDFHRFIIFYSHSWTEHWSFKSEVELEHNFVKEGQGELELEQASVNYHSDKFGFQAGVILPTVGIMNEYHEPPLFVSVERPNYSKYVVPTTWFGNGAAIQTTLGGVKLRFALMEDMEGEGIGKGIRGGRGKGYKTTAYDFVKNLSASYTGIQGLRIGGSYTMNNAPIDNEPDTTIGFGLMEVNMKYNANNIYAVLEYGTISYSGTNATPSYDQSGGYYLDLGYNIGSMVGMKGVLMPWFRYSDYTRGNDDPTVHWTIQRFGLTYWPIDKVVFKFEYGTNKKESADDADTEINVGAGYYF